MSTGKIPNLLQSFVGFNVMWVLLRPPLGKLRPHFQNVSLTEFVVCVWFYRAFLSLVVLGSYLKYFKTLKSKKITYFIFIIIWTQLRTLIIFIHLPKHCKMQYKQNKELWKWNLTEGRGGNGQIEETQSYIISCCLLIWLENIKSKSTFQGFVSAAENSSALWDQGKLLCFVSTEDEYFCYSEDE